MDMSANLGGFAASLKKKNVWVMNVVPFMKSGKLKIIYDRGLMGTTHDWCESFSTYPRTYDLLHAWLLFSEIEKQGCSLEDLLIEMDRILRPYGYAIIRDKVDVVTYIKKHLPALRWKGITLKKSAEQGIQSAKLPIGNYLKMSSSQVLTVNQVFEIMLKFVETRDWKTAFFHVIPQRKRGEAETGD
uniref:Methyltransferase n=1 Tax=Zea mays TaxID=4577 RepID=A0A804NKZ9_MAIZE